MLSKVSRPSNEKGSMSSNLIQVQRQYIPSSSRLVLHLYDVVGSPSLVCLAVVLILLVSEAGAKRRNGPLWRSSGGVFARVLPTSRSSEHMNLEGSSDVDLREDRVEFLRRQGTVPIEPTSLASVQRRGRDGRGGEIATVGGHRHGEVGPPPRSLQP
jgi:hypothetical protein